MSESPSPVSPTGEATTDEVRSLLAQWLGRARSADVADTDNMAQRLTLLVREQIACDIEAERDKFDLLGDNRQQWKGLNAAADIARNGGSRG